MAALSDYVAVRARFARSANLERDSGRSEPFDGYLVTGRALDMIGRLTPRGPHGAGRRRVVSDGVPYGSGEVLARSPCSTPPSAPAKRLRSTALDRITEASPAAAEAVRQAHDHHRTRRTGFPARPGHRAA